MGLSAAETKPPYPATSPTATLRATLSAADAAASRCQVVERPGQVAFAPLRLAQQVPGGRTQPITAALVVLSDSGTEHGTAANFVGDGLDVHERRADVNYIVMAAAAGERTSGRGSPLTPRTQPAGAVMAMRQAGGDLLWEAQVIEAVGLVAVPDGGLLPCVHAWRGEGSVNIDQLLREGEARWVFPGEGGRPTRRVVVTAPRQ